MFSGVKAGRRGEVPSLFDLCMQVIKDNIGELGFTGGIPYDILKPALERANPQQLMLIEGHNDYLIGELFETPCTFKFYPFIKGKHWLVHFYRRNRRALAISL